MHEIVSSQRRYLMNDPIHRKAGMCVNQSAPPAIMSVFLMLNHQFVTICEQEAIIVQGGTGKLYRQVVNLSLEGKENQLYSICLPLQKGIPAVFSTSDKILMILE